MLVPLQNAGLEAGDDAILFGLTDPEGASEDELRALTGLDAAALDMRLARLGLMGVIDRPAVGPLLLPGARLTERGREIAVTLTAQWRQLDDALIGELKPKSKKKLRKILKRFVRLLAL